MIAGVDSLGNVYAFWPGTTDLDAEVELRLGGPYGCGDAWLETVYASVYVQPHIDSISPTSAMVGTSGRQITIDGSGFGSSPSVNLPSGFTSTGQGSTDSRIVITVSINVNTAIGNTAISVTAGGQTSNSVAFTADGPDHMVVAFDTWDYPYGNGTIARHTKYQVINFSGSIGTGLSIGEDPTATGWNCNQTQPGIHFNACGTNPVQTDASGMFTDNWSLLGAYTPVGCGISTTDHWYWCAPTPPKRFSLLDGYVHNDAVSTNGYVVPSNTMPQYTVVPK